MENTAFESWAVLELMGHRVRPVDYRPQISRQPAADDDVGYPDDSDMQF